MEQLGSLPSADAVLNKVKSDGTFDQFRKTCLATVEAEPSIRAYGEQIEVLSRRYLQDHYHKWSNSITKNEVRAKLKDYILTMIANPDVGIGIPLQTMVEKSLEKNGPKVLLPQILDAVDTLRDAKPQTSSSPDKPAGASSDPVEEGKGVSLEGVAPGKASSELGPLGLPLPISIPGLNPTVGRKESVGGGDTGAKAKPKSKGSGETSAGVSAAKEGGKAVTKVSTQKGILGKPAGGKDGVKQREKEEKGSAEEKEAKESSQADEGPSKEKGRGGGGGVKSKRPSKDEKEKPVPKEKEVVEKQKAPAAGAVKEKDSSTEVKEGSGRRDSGAKREKDQKEPVKREQKTETKEAKPEQRKASNKEQEGQEEAEEVCEAEESKTASQTSGGGSSRRKQVAPKRRSARLSSLNEESSEDQDRGSNEKTKTNKVAEGAEIKEESKAAESGRKKDTQAEKSKSLSAPKAAGRKRMRLLDSSSEESDALQQSNSEEEEKGYESETEQGKEEEEDKRPKRKRLRGREITRLAPSTDDSGSKDSAGKRSRKRAMNSSKEGKEWSEKPASKKVKKSAARQETKQSQKQTTRVKSPSPVVVTRYNRRVKPNRRYNSPSGEQTASSNGEEREATPPT